MIITSSFFVPGAKNIRDLGQEHLHYYRIIIHASITLQFSTSSTAAIVISPTSIITTSFFQRAIPLTESNSQIIICITNMIPSDFEAVILVHNATDFSNEQNRDFTESNDHFDTQASESSLFVFWPAAPVSKLNEEQILAEKFHLFGVACCFTNQPIEPPHRYLMHQIFRFQCRHPSRHRDFPNKHNRIMTRSIHEQQTFTPISIGVLFLDIYG
ncbi:hypothetical protein F4604DRAFT_1297135 [Suillus subluteus]|nr:hypothetical protein F4604DRAFT_1297135 [Suillus subluteus]